VAVVPNRPGERVSADAQTEVLIVKVGAIGDVVMGIPAAVAARELGDDVRVTWLCGTAVEPLLRFAGVADELVVVDERALWSTSRLARIGAVLSVWRRLAGRRFDLVAIGHPDPRYRLLTLFVRARTTRSWSRRGRRAWPLWGRYHGDENVRLVLGGDAATLPRRPYPALHFPFRGQLADELGDVPDGRVVLVPGSAKNPIRDDALRRWPLEHYVELAQRLVAEGRQVVLAGSPDDAWTREAFSGVDVADAIGRTSLVELCGLMQHSDLVITHDGGPLHLALLARTRLIALFGPTSPHEKVPEREGVVVLWGGADLACRPCYDGNDYANCPLNVCLREVSVERVHEEADRLLQQSAAALGGDWERRTG
jgi:heptosyltransferase-2